MVDLHNIYLNLLAYHGTQGWWPIVKNNRACRYHTGAPATANQSFEIIIGAILTQGVAWNNVEKAIIKLKTAKLLTPRKLERAPDTQLAELIRSTGYYNQKVKKIRAFLSWFKKYSYSIPKIASMEILTLRLELLTVKGIGPETADSILLYALRKKIFVIDAYTMRIFTRLGMCSATDSYEHVQDYCHTHFTGNNDDYNEFHALIVAQGSICKKTSPLCPACPINNLCYYYNR